MNLEQQLLELLLSRANTIEIRKIAEELEKESNFTLGNDFEMLSGIWELRWSSSKAPFLNYSPLVDNLQICLLYTSPSPRDATLSRMPSSA